jgi:hypothetical protein
MANSYKESGGYNNPSGVNTLSTPGHRPFPPAALHIFCSKNFWIFDKGEPQKPAIQPMRLSNLSIAKQWELMAKLSLDWENFKATLSHGRMVAWSHGRMVASYNTLS